MFGQDMLAYLGLAGVGLAQLQKWLNKCFPDRESHSVLGSTFLNPTTAAAGVAFGSGGTQCRKGPAYTNVPWPFKLPPTNGKNAMYKLLIH